MRRHLVTGGAGFIGAHLARALRGLGDDVVVVDDLSGGTTSEQVRERLTDIGITFLRRPAAAVHPDSGPFQVVWHLASPVGPVGVLRRRGDIALDIVSDAAAMADLAYEWSAQLVYVSTSELYGPQPGAAGEADNCVTTPAYSARQEYAVGKLAAEVMLLNRDEVNLRIVRPFNIAGPWQRPGGGFVIPRWIEQHKAGLPITVYGDGSQLRAFTHVTDFVEGMLLVQERGKRDRYNVGNPDNLTSLRELALCFAAMTGAEIDYVDPVQLHGPNFREAPDKWPDATKTKALGWQPWRDNSLIIFDALEAAAR